LGSYIYGNGGRWGTFGGLNAGVLGLFKNNFIKKSPKANHFFSSESPPSTPDSIG